MIRGIILDWAGTAIDYGSTAPAQVFVRAFSENGLEATLEEARRPMGLPKRDHVREMLKMTRIAAQFTQQHGHAPDEGGVDRIYASSERMLFEVLGERCQPLPGVLEVVEALRGQGLRIGSTTGYTRRMMDEIVIPGARANGYQPDSVVTPDQVPAGRPFPYMCYLNALRLEMWPLWQCIKVGDTLADIAEGRNAGMWTIGVLQGSSLVGCSWEDEQGLSPLALQQAQARAREAYTNAGADMVLDRISDLPAAVSHLADRVASGQHPVLPIRLQ